MNALSTSVQYGFIVEPKHIVPPLVEQVHGSEIVEVKGPAHRESLFLLPPKADAVFTRERGVDLHIFTADCLPLLFFSSNPEGPVAAVHCGWRGGLGGIAKKALQIMQPLSAEVHVVFGPAILPCCFEVKDDFVTQFESSGKQIERFIEKSRGRMFFDLPRYVRETELAALPETQIHRNENRCTYCSAPPLPSFRRNGGTDPRIRAWIRKRPL